MTFSTQKSIIHLLYRPVSQNLMGIQNLLIADQLYLAIIGIGALVYRLYIWASADQNFTFQRNLKSYSTKIVLFQSDSHIVTPTLMRLRVSREPQLIVFVDDSR